MERPATESSPPPMTASGALSTLKRRADFLRVAKGQRRQCGAFSLQAAPARTAGPRVGYTVTRATGTAVERNRIRRRLRAAIEAAGSQIPIADYVIVARRGVLSEPFPKLTAGIAQTMRQIARRLSDSTTHAAGR